MRRGTKGKKESKAVQNARAIKEKKELELKLAKETQKKFDDDLKEYMLKN
jgi:hypothetical protein